MKKILYTGTILFSLGALWTSGLDQSYADDFGNELIDIVEKNQIASVYKVIKNGANVNKRGKYQNTALIKAAAAGYVEIGKALIENGANINLQNISGASALHRAAANGNISFVKLLLGKKADINIKDGEGWTPLMAAVARKRAEIVAFLLENGADTEPVSFFGENALHIAVKIRSEDMVNLLLEAKANPMSKNSKGQTAYEIADKKSPAVAAIITSYLNNQTLKNKQISTTNQPKTYQEFIRETDNDEKIQLNALLKAEEDFKKAAKTIESAKLMAEIKNVEAQLKIEKAKEALSKIKLRRELAEQAMLSRKAAKEKKIQMENLAKIKAEKQLQEITRRKQIEEAKRILLAEEVRLKSLHMEKTKKAQKIAEKKLEEQRQEEYVQIKEQASKTQQIAELRKQIEIELRQALETEFFKKTKELEEQQKKSSTDLRVMKKYINVEIKKANQRVAEKNAELEKLKEYANSLEIQQVRLVRKIKSFLQTKSNDVNKEKNIENSDNLTEMLEQDNQSPSEQRDIDSLDLSSQIQQNKTIKLEKPEELESTDGELKQNTSEVNNKPKDLVARDVNRILKIKKEIMALEAIRQAKILETNITNSESFKNDTDYKKIVLSENTASKRKRRVPLGNKKNVDINNQKEIFIPKAPENVVVSKKWWESSESLDNNNESIDVNNIDIQKEKMTKGEIDKVRKEAIERLRKAKEEIISDRNTDIEEISEKELDEITDIEIEENAFENKKELSKDGDNKKEKIFEEKLKNIKEISEKMNQVQNIKPANYNRILALKRLRAARDKIARVANRKKDLTPSTVKMFDNEITELAVVKPTERVIKRAKVINDARKRAHDIMARNNSDNLKYIKSNKKRNDFLSNLEKELSKQDKNSDLTKNTKKLSGGNKISKLPWKESKEKDLDSIDQGGVKITKIRSIDDNFSTGGTEDNNRRNIEKIAKIIASIEKTSTLDNKTSVVEDTKNSELNKSYFVSNKGEYKFKFPSGKFPSGKFSGGDSKNNITKRNSANAYWLKIGNFVDSRTAYQHYRNVTNEYIITGLQYRPVYSAKPGMNNVSFKIGPLKSIKEASKLCMKFRGNNLGCSTVATAK